MKNDTRKIISILDRASWIEIKGIHRYFLAHPELLTNEKYNSAYEYNRKVMYDTLSKSKRKKMTEQECTQYDFVLGLDNNLNPERFEQFEKEAMRYADLYEELNLKDFHK